MRALSEREALARFEEAVERCAALGLFAQTFDPHAYAQADAVRVHAQAVWEQARRLCACTSGGRQQPLRTCAGCQGSGEAA